MVSKLCLTFSTMTLKICSFLKWYQDYQLYQWSNLESMPMARAHALRYIYILEI